LLDFAGVLKLLTSTVYIRMLIHETPKSN